MVGTGRKPKGAKAGASRAFNPLWLLDAAGLLAAAALAWLLASPPALADGLTLPLLREACLAVVVVALSVRILDGRARSRARRTAARAELLRRLTGLDDALMDLRRSLSRDAARRFVERRAAFAEGMEATRKHLDDADGRQAAAGVAFCAELTDGLAETVRRRAGIASLAYRIRQEIGRARRRSEIDQPLADELSALVEDALAVMDEALYAEWNADHFGRLAAIQGCFARGVERGDGEILREIDHQAAELFAALAGHVREKVGVIDALKGWDEVCNRLTYSLAGVAPADRMRPATPARAPALADRFAATPVPASVVRGAQPLRLPAAND